MAEVMGPRARLTRPLTLRAWRGLALSCLAICACVLYSASAARAAGLVVIPTPASGPALSYFKLAATRGRSVRVGTLGLRNPTGTTMRVALVPVVGETIDTLGSTYAAPARAARGPARWLRIAPPTVTLGPGGSATVPVSAAVPRTARPGDYLAGVSVEVLGQHAETARRGVTIASAVRYAIGVEISIPGRRHGAIKFTGAGVQRQPAGLVFLLKARNTGNVILQNVRGSALVRRGSRVVARVPLGPGTFVTASKIAYPVHAYAETPTEGTRYRVSAYLRYAGGIARLDTTVVFGHRQAVLQAQYGGPKVSGASGGTAWWKIALLAAAVLYGVSATVLLLRRRSRPAQTP
jgi:hypothetical protein